MSEDPAQKRVLVIEDDRALNRAIVFKLQKKGYDVVSVFSAEEGLIVLESGKRIDFIWLDLLLPGMNGIDFLRKVRGEESLRDK
ncbi:MAG TPA: response regulator, partial [Candidatus Paceibacterota bacterium]